MRYFTRILAAALAASCLTFAQSTEVSYAPGIDFSKYHTYRWGTIQNRQHPDPAEDLRLKQLVDSRLAAKGLVKREESADLDVDYQVALGKSVQWEKYQDFDVAAVAKRETLRIDTGTIVLDMYEAASKKLVWTARAKRYIDPKGGAEQMRKRVQTAVEAMLAHFPPN